MIIVTGGAGFIGSAILWGLNEKKYHKIVCVDRWDIPDTWKNITKRQLFDVISHSRLFDYLHEHQEIVSAVIHMGAHSSTTETDMRALIENNLLYSQRIFSFCADQQIPLIYASSAATYGDGERGYSDDPKIMEELRPLNPYGLSKSLFDQWVMKQEHAPPLWAGLKFFNVYGPGEYHKGSMMSLVAKAVDQITASGSVKLFKSYRKGIGDGEQSRDFIYVKDVVKVVLHFLAAGENPKQSSVQSGIYNVGTGKARSFADLVKATFTALEKPDVFEWIEMPESIRDQYQYFTEADMSRLREFGGFSEPFASVEDGVSDYVTNYLATQDRYL